MGEKTLGVELSLGWLILIVIAEVIDRFIVNHLSGFAICTILFIDRRCIRGELGRLCRVKEMTGRSQVCIACVSYITCVRREQDDLGCGLSASFRCRDRLMIVRPR